MTVKVFTLAHLPEELVQAWLQHMRDFDTAHPGCHFEVLGDAAEMSLAEMVEALRVNPALTVTGIIKRKQTSEMLGQSESFRLALEQLATLVERGALSLAVIPLWLRSLAEKAPR